MLSVLKKKALLRGLAIAIMLVTMGPEATWAAGYTFNLSGRDLYEVVLDPKESPDQLRPGIYKISPKTGELEPVIFGEVNWVNRAYKGILSHVNLQGAAAQDSLSVVDKELVLFNFNSSPQKKSSVLRFGGKAQGRIQIVDTLSGRPVDLPPINEREDIQIFEGPILGVSSGLPRGGRVYLVSVKAPSILGSGLTFGFVLPGSSEKESVRVLHDRAFLLSYDFLLQNELSRLVAISEEKSHDGLVVSPLQIQSVRTGLESRLHIGALRHLDAHLSRFLKFTQEVTPNLNGRDVSHVYYGLPVFSLVDGVAVQPAVPVEQISGGEDRTAGIAEVYDPATQRYSLIDWSEGSKFAKVISLNIKTSLSLIPSDKIEGLAFAFSSIDRNPKSGRPYIYGVKQISTPFESKEIDITERFADGFVYFSGSELHLGIRQSSFNQDNLQAIRLAEIKANPGDRIEMVRFTSVEENDRKYHTFLISRQGAKAQKAQVYSLVLEETSSIRLLRSEQIFEGPFLTAAELKLRSVEDGEPLFDNVTRSSGVRNYLSHSKAEEVDSKSGAVDEDVRLSITDMTLRTVPYHRLFHGLRIAEKSYHSGSQRYVLPLSSVQLVPNQLFYEEYDERGAKVLATGFYLKKDGEKPSFLPGYPLFKGVDKQSKEVKLISDSAALTFDNGSAASHPTVHLHLVPFSKKPPHKGKRASAGEMPQKKSGETSSFELGLGLTSPGWHGGPVKGHLGGVQINLPYGSLSFTKIIQGTKANVDTFHVLLFFNENPKVPGSSNAVIVASGRISKSSLLKSQIEVTMMERPVHLHKGIVSANDYKAHLKVDAEGALYWDEDPSMPYDSPKKKVRKLGTTEYVTARSRTMSALRDPDFIKESEVGMTNAGLRLGGHWQIHSRDGLRSHIPGVSELFDKENEQASKNKDEDEKKESKTTQGAGKQPNVVGEKFLVKAFEEYLDSLYQSNRVEDKVRVILVEPDFEPMFRETFFKLLGRTTGNAPFSLKNSSLRFFYAQENLDDVEVAHELRFIASPSRRTRNMLYVEPEHFMNQKIVSRSALDTDSDEEGLESGYMGPEEDDDARDPAKVFKHDDIDSPANLLALLASAGQAKTADGLKKVLHSSPNVPTFILTTPDKWRQVTASKHNIEAIKAGALDKFELNHDFLTSSWSVWPPGSAKSSEEVNGLEKATYNSEEMKVFPTLDHILTQASQGQLKGRQVVLLVPPELKPVIQKLIVLRWSTQDVQNALPWTHANRKLAIFRVSSKDANQPQLQDNFRSIWGASTSRNAVIYGDLETVERIGRPVNPSGKTYVLRDPIKAREDLLDEAAWPIVQNVSKDGDDSTTDQTMPFPFDSQSRAGSTVTELSEERKQGFADALRRTIEEISDQIAGLDVELTALDAKLGEHEIDRDSYDDAYGDIKSARDDLELKRSAKMQSLSRLQETQANEPDMAEGSQLIPHALWWIASEGRLVQPGRSKEWSLKDSVDRSATTILIGTEEELARLEADMTAESRFFSVRDHFDVVRLAPPDEETRFDLVKGLFERPEVAALGLKFHLENNNGRDPKSQLIYHFFNRVDQIAYDIKLEKTTAFVKAFTALKNALAEDPNIRRSRQIDERFIERLFTKVFPMPLNEDILEESDPLKMARNVDSAVRGLQKAGYEGSQDLKRRVIENMLSQTRPTDSSRPIPNSQIFFGKTSKGKTFLIQTLFKWLNLVEYNPNRASNVDADYIFINVAKLTHDQSVDPDKTPVSKVIEQIMDLLVQPKGPRAHIVFDDFHKAVSKEVRVALFQFIQGLFEARNGMITVRSRDGKKVREIPVQNLNLYMTLNPATSEKARAEYIRGGAYYTQAELLKREVLAAIADQGFKPEESVLARWADIVNIDSFPRSAKVPELGKRVRQHSRTSREMIMVEPKVIDGLVGRFEEANARELLAPAAAALTNIPSSATPARLYLVSLREGLSHPYAFGSDLGPINLHQLNSIVRQMTQIDPVQYSDPKSMLKFMGLLLQNFRLQLYNNLILEAHMSDVLRLNLPGTVNLLKSQFLLGAATHIIDHPEIPAREMVIRPEQLSFFTRGQTNEFYAQFRRLSNPQSYFPTALAQREEHATDLEEFVNGQSGLKAHPRTRRDVIHEYVDRLRVELSRFLAIYLRLQDPEAINQMGRWGDAQIRGWFNDLKEENPDAQIRDAMNRILDVFLDFQVAFNSPDVIDSHETNENNQTIVSLFDEVRLFGFMMDKAITSLPWGHVSRFTYEVTQLASDLSLGQKTAFKEYIGNHDLSPFAITTPEFMQDMVEVSRTMVQSPFSLDDLRQGFAGVCMSLLGRKEGGGQ